MKKLLILNLIALSFSLGLAAESHCNQMPNMRKPLPSEWEAVAPAVKTSQKNHLELTVGESSDEIKLKSNPSTGYSWKYVCNDKEKLEIKKEHVRQSTNMVGAGGTDVFTITAKEPGDVVCTFEYGRSWNPASYVEKQEYTITITE